MNDNNLLCEAGDRIDNAVFSAIQELAHDGGSLEWDMSIIGEVSDFIEDLLAEKGIATCHPWQDGSENICYSTSERCKHCQRKVV